MLPKVKMSNIGVFVFLFGMCICKAELEICPPWDCEKQCLEDPRAAECEASGGFVTPIACLKYGPVRTCGCLCTILKSSKENSTTSFEYSVTSRSQSPPVVLKPKMNEHLPNYYLITAVGYTVSLIALLAAFFIFTFNKRLRSPKNNLHMKLFLSFILRCVLFHIKRLNAFSDDLPTFNTSENSTDLTSSNNMSSKPLACKLFTIIWQYSLLEALYLQSLISFNTFTDNSSITRYVIFGWSVPAIIVIPWSVIKYYYENNQCWTSIDNTYIFGIIRGPITLCILLSFIIFVNVIRILYLKIFSSGFPNQIDSKYSKWFRSTLVLVPLFGVHHTLLLICKVLTFNKEIEIILFYFDLIFTSFQGFFVALLYCFFSSEVLAELRKSWRRFRTKKNNQSLRHYPSNRMTSNTFNSVLTQSIKNGDKYQIDKQTKCLTLDEQSLENGLIDKGMMTNNCSSTKSEISNNLVNGKHIDLNETNQQQSAAINSND